MKGSEKEGASRMTRLKTEYMKKEQKHHDTAWNKQLWLEMLHN